VRFFGIGARQLRTDQSYSNIRAEKEANATERRIFDDLFSKNGFKDICKNYCQ